MALRAFECGSINDCRPHNWQEATTVFKEKRKVPRHVFNRMAQFQNEICPLPRSILVTDISERGARLFSEIEMPPTFTLSLSGEGVAMRRDCRVVWQLGGEIGVEFVDRDVHLLEAAR